MVEEITEKEFYKRIKDGLTVIDFFAEWCMPCLMMAPILDEVEEKFKGKINFAKINVDDNSEIASKYGVMSIPTFVIFKDGKEIERFTGAMTSEQFEENLGKFLK